MLMRTIPTRVGRTLRDEIVTFFRTDHPHACGENTGLPIGYSGMFQGFSGNQNG